MEIRKLCRWSEQHKWSAAKWQRLRWANAPNGEQQTGFMYNLGTISQNIDFKQAGDYTLSFYIAARAHALPSGSTQSIMVTNRSW
jgi:hypothetical protein